MTHTDEEIIRKARDAAQALAEQNCPKVSDLINTMASRLEELKPKKRRLRLKTWMTKADEKVPAYPVIMIGRNSSYWNSLVLGLLAVPFNFPTSLWGVIKEPTLGLLEALVALPVALGSWIVAQVLLVVFSLFGMVTIGTPEFDVDDKERMA